MMKPEHKMYPKHHINKHKHLIKKEVPPSTTVLSPVQRVTEHQNTPSISMSRDMQTHEHKEKEKQNAFIQKRKEILEKKLFMQTKQLEYWKEQEDELIELNLGLKYRLMQGRVDNQEREEGRLEREKQKGRGGLRQREGQKFRESRLKGEKQKQILRENSPKGEKQKKQKEKSLINSNLQDLSMVLELQDVSRLSAIPLSAISFQDDNSEGEVWKQWKQEHQSASFLEKPSEWESLKGQNSTERKKQADLSINQFYQQVTDMLNSSSVAIGEFRLRQQEMQIGVHDHIQIRKSKAQKKCSNQHNRLLIMEENVDPNNRSPMNYKGKMIGKGDTKMNANENVNEKDNFFLEMKNSPQKMKKKSKSVVKHDRNIRNLSQTSTEFSRPLQLRHKRTPDVSQCMNQTMILPRTTTHNDKLLLNSSCRSISTIGIKCATTMTKKVIKKKFCGNCNTHLCPNEYFQHYEQCMKDCVERKKRNNDDSELDKGRQNQKSSHMLSIEDLEGE